MKIACRTLHIGAAVFRLVLALGLIASSVANAECFEQSSEKPRPSSSTRGVPAQERHALMALFESTDGNHWKDREGWLGPPSSECSWKGVECESPEDGPTYVVALDLSANNLHGSIPELVGQLTRLESLYIFGNHLSGQLPDRLIARWLSGSLYISAEVPLLTGISEIDFESSASALLCMQRRIVLRSDNSAVLFTERCRNSTPEDRTTFCEVKEGRLSSIEFAKLARLIANNDFFGLHAHYERNVTEGAFESTRVTRDGRRYEVVNYAGAGPFNLWVVQNAIEGVTSSVDWEKTMNQAKCPRWNESQVPSAQ